MRAIEAMRRLRDSRANDILPFGLKKLPDPREGNSAALVPPTQGSTTPATATQGPVGLDKSAQRVREEWKETQKKRNIREDQEWGAKVRREREQRAAERAAKAAAAQKK